MTLNTFQNTNVDKELGLTTLEEKPWLPWRHDQAMLLVEKFKTLKGESDKWSEDFVR